MLQTDRRSVVLDTARVVGDTLIGVVSEPRHASSPSRRVAVPLSQVLELQVRKADSLRTAAVIAAVLLLIGGVTFALAFGQGLWEWYGEIAEAED